MTGKSYMEKSRNGKAEKHIKIIVAGIILSAGKSRRMGGKTPKCFLELNGKKLLEYSVEKFLVAGTDILVVATPPKSEKFMREAERIIKNVLEKKKKRHLIFSVIYGGRTRWESFRKSFSELKKLVRENMGEKHKSPASVVVVEHDGARPNFSVELLRKVIETAKKKGGAIPFITPRETVREKKGKKEPFSFTKEMKRENIALVQTPQAFRLDVLEECLKKMKEEKKRKKVQPTDLAGLIFKYKKEKVKGVVGESTNIKITFPEDMKIAEVLLNMSKQ